MFKHLLSVRKAKPGETLQHKHLQNNKQKQTAKRKICAKVGKHRASVSTKAAATATATHTERKKNVNVKKVL